MRACIIVAVFFLFLTVAFGEQTTGVWSARSAPRSMGSMRLELQRVTGTTVRLTIFNGSAQTYWVNDSMLWNSPSAPRELRQVDMEVTGSDGRTRLYGCRDYARKAVRPDYVVLNPGQLVGSEMTLSDCLDMRRPGRYRVVARYLDSSEIEGLHPGYPRFDQSLTSPPLILVTNGEETNGPYSPQSNPKLSGSFRLELQRVTGTTVRLTIYNGSERIYWVNHSMLWNAPVAPRELRSIDMDVTGPDGKRLLYACGDHARKAVPADYIALYPAQFVGSEITLADCLDLRRPGRYRVVARFLDSSDIGSLQPNHPRFSQPLTSPPVELVID